MFHTIIFWLLTLGFSGNIGSANPGVSTNGYGIGGAPVQRMVTTDGYGIGGSPVQRPVNRNGYGIGG